MAFSRVPEESKSQINKAGALLAKGDASAHDWAWAMNVADRWRACHAYPINTFQATLRTKLRKYKGRPIAAQRLKRMPTIIDKLRRYPAMKLTTMQDIGGVRAILGFVKDVYRLADEYRESRRLTHELSDQKDYVENPRSEDGYRSIHLIYKYKNPLTSHYDGLRIELQIRTRLQHIWATAVESMGTFLGQALKSRQGDQQWLDFFAVTSSAFAYMEKRPPVPRFAHLSREDTVAMVARAETQLHALEMMRGLSVAANEIVRSGGGQRWFYHLIILNSLDRRVEIEAYDRDSFERAVADYGKVEARAAQGESLEPVLVSAGPIETLRRAYPNFFLDIGDFARIVAAMTTERASRKGARRPSAST